MNKSRLHELILVALQERLEVARNAAKQAHESATHEENVAENKYDTLGLEASYLAAGQSVRVAECESDLNRFRKLAIVEFDGDMELAPGALVWLKNQQATRMCVFLSPVAGGLKLAFESEPVLLVTPSAPLGKALLGAFVDDEVSVGSESYRILSVC